jgi:hypothetical protein
MEETIENVNLFRTSLGTWAQFVRCVFFICFSPQFFEHRYLVHLTMLASWSDFGFPFLLPDASIMGSG